MSTISKIKTRNSTALQAVSAHRVMTAPLRWLINEARGVAPNLLLFDAPIAGMKTALV